MTEAETERHRILSLLAEAYATNGQEGSLFTQMEAFAGEVLLRLRSAIENNTDYIPIPIKLGLTDKG